MNRWHSKSEKMIEEEVKLLLKSIKLTEFRNFKGTQEIIFADDANGKRYCHYGRKRFWKDNP